MQLTGPAQAIRSTVMPPGHGFHLDGYQHVFIRTGRAQTTIQSYAMLAARRTWISISMPQRIGGVKSDKVGEGAAQFLARS